MPITSLQQIYIYETWKQPLSKDYVVPSAYLDPAQGIYGDVDNEPCGSEESGGATPALRAWAESFSSPWRRCWQGLFPWNDRLLLVLRVLRGVLRMYC
ncbi:hypothetical protein Ac2012v2_002156 [Leucoagaricus gongylophorus]